MVGKWGLLSAARFIGLAFTTSAQTQDASEKVADKQAVNPEIIVVTARKNAESIQDVPLAITAFSAKDLRNRSMTTLQDIALQKPGFVYEDYSNGGFGTPTIRGATQFSITKCLVPSSGGSDP